MRGDEEERGERSVMSMVIQNNPGDKQEKDRTEDESIAKIRRL